MPVQPKIFHICHVDRLAPIVAAGGLLSDAAVVQAAAPGTVIGMNHIKQRRLQELRLNSHPGLYVGQCVPFYFCPRSVMLFLIHRQNADLAYKGGQGPIIHLEADLHATVAWANAQPRRWAFTLSNAGSCYFEDRADLARLGDVDWDAVAARNWSACREAKQAEFLLEHSFPWHLVERIGVLSQPIATQVAQSLPVGGHRPPVQILPAWYY
ncbi:MAG: type II toxin-antitoxin system toxin DNA ADP-ribosyl transferase DarT [Rubrivivax sp.]